MSEQVQVSERRGGVIGALRRTREFLVAVRAELGKVSWPTQQELIKATRMVIILTLIIGVVLGLVDLLLTKVLIDGVAALSR